MLRRRGVATIEAQTMGTNAAAWSFYSKLGFTEIDHGVVLRKDGHGHRAEVGALEVG